MTMADRFRTSATRRRAHSSASASASASTKNSAFNENIHNVRSNATGQHKLHKYRPRKSQRPEFRGEVSRFVRRKGKNISRIKLMCSKFGKLRMIDVALSVAVATKLASFFYSRRIPSPSTQHDLSMPSLQRDVSSSVSLEPDLPTEEEPQSFREKWNFPKWVKRWEQNQMPFHSPLLYRREDDDYFAYGSYLDDEGEGRSKKKKNVRFRGIFHADSYYNHHKEQLNSHGYAVVDDLLYYADDYRESTLLALNESKFEVNLECIGCVTDWPAFEFPDDEKEDHRHYIEDDDAWDEYYSFDDDLVRGTRGMGLKKEEDSYDDEEEEEGEEEENDSINETERDICTRPSFYRTYYPTCNEMHASVGGYQWLLGEEIYSRHWKKRKHWSYVRSQLSKYLSHGYYRDAFLFQSTFVSFDENDKPSTQWDKVVFKTMRHMYEGTEVSEDDEYDSFHRRMAFDPADKYTFFNYREDMRKDAMLMELLSSSPRATDLYSHCAMSSVTEFAPTDMEEYILPTAGFPPDKVRRGAKGKKMVEPLNDYISPEEKLEIALEMAKCIAVMHGFRDGAIAHVDVQVSQFFRGRDGLIKIVDYNRAEPLLYDAKNEQYCKWKNGFPGDGSLRAPEENIDDPLTEKIDIFSLGNVLYALLTGMLAWGDYDSEEKINYIIRGIQLKIPDLYNESPASRLLVDAIRSCWTHDVDDRPSIFWLVDFLEQAVAKYPATEKAWG